MKQIAEQIAEEFDRPASDLKKKRYSKLTNIHEMKQEFVKRCRQGGYTNHEIADFMDYTPKSVSTMYSRAVGQIKFKWMQVLDAMRDGGARPEDFDFMIRGHIKRIRKKGYHVYQDGQTYKLG